MDIVKRILIMSVGGSATPLLKAMRESKADYFYFICSKDSDLGQPGSFRMVDQLVPPGRKCQKCNYQEPAGKSLIEQVGGISKGDINRYKVVLLESPDSLEDCYIKAVMSINEARAAFPDADIILDYTGGTKSMSAGLAIAGMDTGCEFALVKGNRSDLVKVKDGTERWAKMRKSKIYLEQQIKIARDLTGRWDFSAAAGVIEEAGRMNSDPEDEKRIQYLSDLARALDAWDRFEFERASELLSNNLKDMQNRLRKIIGAQKWYLSQESFNPKRDVFCIVYDCLRNAERRGSQKRYDDAAARLYRALEMYGQFALRAVTGMRSDEILLDALPVVLQEKYRKRGKVGSEKAIVQLGLDAVYTLLYDLHGVAEDSVTGCENREEVKNFLRIGQIYKEKAINKEIAGALKIRNYSFLAHGFVPVNQADYEKMESIIFDFIHRCDQAVGIKEPFAGYPQLELNF